MNTQELVRQRLSVGEMDCPSCAARIERGLLALPGVSGAQVNFAAGQVAVTFDPASITLPTVAAEIERLGYSVRWDGDGARAAKEEGTAHAAGAQKSQVARWGPTVVAGLGIGLAFLLERLGAAPIVSQLFYALAILVGGMPIARSAYTALRGRHTTDINFLMTIAAAGAVLLGEWAEAATVLVLFTIAEALEAHSVERTRHALRDLVHLAPDHARIRGEHREMVVPVSEVRVGDLLLVRPGDRIPLDGEVVSGASSVNEAPITGESLPVEKLSGDVVFAGSLNENGSLEVRVTREAGETTLARIARLVEEAQARRSPTEQFIDRFARYYTPAILAGAALLAVVPPLLLGAPFATCFYRALTLLLIACPCALVISTPVAVVCALARAARMGALIKGGEVLERLAAIRSVAFDKTGTLTHGRPQVTDIIPIAAISPEELLLLAAGVERHSEHAVGHAILEHARHLGIAAPNPTEFATIPGKGARAVVEGRRLTVGKPELFSIGPLPPIPPPRGGEGGTLPTPVTLPLSASGRGQGGGVTDAIAHQTTTLQSQGKTVVYLGDEGELLGLLAVTDTAREASRTAIEGLRGLGIDPVVMLTGDNHRTAAAIAKELGIERFEAELLPAEKLGRVEALVREHGSVAMVGDGINDAPALAAASVGVAMGAAGTGVALETADVALMGDELGRLPAAIALGRRAVRTIRWNIGLALGMKAAFIVLTLAGYGSLWLAVMADMGCSLLVVANSLRLLNGARSQAA